MPCLLCRFEKEGVSPNYTQKNQELHNSKKKKMHKEKGKKIPQFQGSMKLAMCGLLLSGGRGCLFEGDLNS